ncbi:MAG TPA: chemotaxis protein CheB [Acidimicrobiales bacterium]|nr:chemotaxis protein CheB [Acidimicrobiales bacterium]
MPEEPVPAPAVIVLGASAGGVEALSAVVANFPPDLPAAVMAVLHLPSKRFSVLPAILSRAGPLPARHPADGELLVAGTVYVAPPDHHLSIRDGRARLARGPREYGHRPSVDVLFRSAAEAYGPAACGVVLSGYLDDGAAGLAAVRRAGGFTIVQDPEDAIFPDMPTAAAELVRPDVVCPAAAVYRCLSAWLDGVRRGPPPRPAAAVPDPPDEGGRPEIEPTEFTCPECGGTLWLADEHGALRYRCRVGHGYSATGLLAGKQEALEAALWSAVVALEERRDLNRRIRDRLGAGEGHRRAYYDREIMESERRAQVLRDLFEDLVEAVEDVGEKAGEDVEEEEDG